MELSRKALSAITACGDPLISDEAYTAIQESVFLFDKPSEETDKLMRRTEMKQAHAGLLTLLLEACKNDCDSNVVSSVLEECKVPADRSAKFIKKYQGNKNKIQLVLSKIGRSHDHIIDASWRQDCVIKTNSCEKVGEPSYIISLKTLNAETNSVGNVTFGCTIEQLQDLVFKLKDASKCIERTASH